MIKSLAKLLFWILICIFTLSLIANLYAWVKKPNLTQDDLQAIKIFKSSYGDKYQLTFNSTGLYMYLKPKGYEIVQTEEAFEIAKIMLFKDYEKRVRRDTDYVYIIIYKKTKSRLFPYDFDYKVAYYPRADSFVIDREHMED